MTTQPSIVISTSDSEGKSAPKQEISMTAIFGIIQHDQAPIQPGTLQAVGGSLRQQAEHGLDIWQNGNIALGQALTRFWSNSAPTPAPERDNEYGLTLVADARLDNRAELASRLHISSADLSRIPDSRLILHAYKIWGQDCPEYLLGDFVFAVWDAHNQTLFAARDPIGIRWLYYFASPHRFALASDIAGLLDLMDEAPKIDPQSLDKFLTFQQDIPANAVFYENIHKLQPGQVLQFQNGNLKTWYYWQAENIQADPALRDPHEGIEILRNLLHQAVACRAETVDRLGTHLSGGLDSSALTALAVTINRNTGRPDPAAFSWSPPPEMRPLMENDERVYVQHIAEYLRIPVTYTHVPPRVDILHEVSDPSTLPLNTVRFEHTVMENARQQGVRVLLSGWGGDELVFSRGIGYPSGLIRQGRWLALARYLKYQYGWRPQRWVSGLYSHGIYPLLPAHLQMRLFHVQIGNRRDSMWSNFDKFRQEKLLKLPVIGFFNPAFYKFLELNHQPKFEWIRPGLRNSQQWYLTKLLNRIESWAAWSARLGARHAYPLLDQRIVEFTLSMPEDWIYHGGKLREFGKQAIADDIPTQLFEGRDKQDRALFAHQKTLEHKHEVRKGRLEIFEAHRKSNPPAAQWLNFDYLRRVLLEPPATIDNPRPPGEYLPTRGLWNVLNLTFIDRRATIDDE
jgi:asparagine synthase (glutamine-hydrolysing)